MNIDFSSLREPFPPEDVEWRLQECGKKGDKVWAMCLAYITNRAIMQRLDDVCGPANWKNEYSPGPQGGVVCGLSIRCDGEWVTKWDGADNTQVEATKGGLSDAMKRAGVQWGIGRYLYNLESGFAIITEGGEYRGKTKDGTLFKWNPPKLPVWALPACKPKPKADTPLPPTPTPPPQTPPPWPSQKPQLSETQAKYFPRVKEALDFLFGTDTEAKKKEIAALTEFKAGNGEMVAGVADYRTLDGKRLQILCHKLETTVTVAKKNQECPFCHQTGGHSDRCPEAVPPVAP